MPHQSSRGGTGGPTEEAIDDVTEEAGRLIFYRVHIFFGKCEVASITN